MARIFNHGFEASSIIYPFTLSEPTTYYSWNTTEKRTGNNSLSIGAVQAPNSPGKVGAYLAGNPTEAYFRFGFKPSTLDARQFFAIRGETDTELVAVYYTGNGFAVLVNGTPVLSATVMDSISYNMFWWLVELRVRMSTGLVTLKVNGVEYGTWEGSLSFGGDTYLSTFWFGRFTSNQTETWYLDDVAVNDTSGSADNSWCGNGGFLLSRPNAAGDLAQWTRSTGTTNYSLVDEAGNPSDTDYVYTTTLNAIDLYNTANPSLATGATVLRVIPWAAGRVVNAGYADHLAVGIKTGGSEYWDSGDSLSQAYTIFEGNEYRINPQTGIAWTSADLTALQVGIKVV